MNQVSTVNPVVLGISALGWQALSTIVAVLAFLGALIVGYRQLSAARRIREEQSRPYVVVDLVPSLAAATLVDLVITNIGTTPAYDLHVTFDPPPERAREDAPQFELKDARILNEQTTMVAPGREFRMFFDSAPERYSSGLPMRFTVATRYRDSGHRTYEESVMLDFDLRRGAMFTEVNGVHEAVAELKKIRQALRGETEI